MKELIDRSKAVGEREKERESELKGSWMMGVDGGRKLRAQMAPGY